MHLVKNTFLGAVVLCLFSLAAQSQIVQPMRYDNYSFTKQVNIGSGTARITAPSAYLEIGPRSGATKGMLPPVCTTAEMMAISSPAPWLTILNSDSAGYCVYNPNTSAWYKISGSGSSYTFTNGITESGGTVTLTNDTTAFANSFYGTNAVGRRGYRPLSDISVDTTSLSNRINEKLNITDTANMRPRLYAGTNITITGTYPNVTISSTSSGGSTDTILYDLNPSAWLVTPTAAAEKNLPEFHTGFPEDPPGSYYESSMYTPSPVIMNDGRIYVWTKGDLNKTIYGWRSIDNGVTYDTIGQSLNKGGAGTFDEFSIAMPMAYHISASDSIYLYYSGIPQYPYENGGLGLAVSSGTNPNMLTKKKQALSIPDFKTQMGISHNLIYISLGSVVKYNGEYWFHGGYWKGGFGMTDSTIRIWEGHSTSLDTIKNCREILAPPAPFTQVDMPTVFRGADSAWYMIFCKGYTDENGGIDSAMFLMSARSASLTSSNWEVLPGKVYEHDADSTWKGKRVYNAKLLKDEWGIPIRMSTDTAHGAATIQDTEQFYQLFYSGSYRNSYHDQSSILRLLPQSSTQSFGIGYNGNRPSVVNRNATAIINIPPASLTKDGILLKEDFLNFSNKAPIIGSNNYIQNQVSNIQTGNLWINNIASVGILGINGGTGSILEKGYFGADAVTGVAFRGDRFNIESKAGLFFSNIQFDTRNSSITTTPVIISSPHVKLFATPITQNNYSLLNVGDIIYPTLPSPFNTTFSALTNYSARFINLGYRETGSNDLTNVAAYFSASGAQKNFAAIFDDGNVGIGTSSPNSKLEVSGSFATKYTATATGITLNATHCVVNVTATGQTITLPTASGITGRQYTIKLTASGSCTVDGNGSETIDGATTYSLASQYKYVTIVSDGSNWIITANN